MRTPGLTRLVMSSTRPARKADTVKLFTEPRDRQSLAYSLSAFAQLGLDTAVNASSAFGVTVSSLRLLAAAWERALDVAERRLPLLGRVVEPRRAHALDLPPRAVAVAHAVGERDGRVEGEPLEDRAVAARQPPGAGGGEVGIAHPGPAVRVARHRRGRDGARSGAGSTGAGAR